MQTVEAHEISPPLPLSQFADAMARLTPSAHIAGLLEVTGAFDSAGACRIAAAQLGDVNAVVANTLANSLQADENAARLIRDAVEYVVRGVQDDALSPQRAADALSLLWAFTLGIHGNVQGAEEILYVREALLPAGAFPTLGRRDGRITARHILNALVAILKTLQSTDDAVEQGRLALRMQFIAAGVPVPEFRGFTLPLEAVGLGGAELALLLHRIDRACATDEEDVELDAAFDRIFELIGDHDEIGALRLRRVRVAARDEDADAATRLLDADDGRQRRISYEVAGRDIAYVAALREHNHDGAARIALTRAQRTSDPRLSVAWGVRGLILLAEADATVTEIAHAVGRVREAVSRCDTPMPAVRALVEDVAIACCLGRRDLPGAERVVADARDCREMNLLRALLTPTGEDPVSVAILERCVDAGPAIEPLVPVFAARVGDAGRAADVLGLGAARVPGTDRARRLRELKLYLELFDNLRPADVLREAEALVVSDEPSIPALWALWMGAHQLGELDQHVDRWVKQLDDADGEMRIHLNAAIAEALVDAGRASDSSIFLSAIPDVHWCESIRGRKKEEAPELTETGSWGALAIIAELLKVSPELSARLDHGRRQLKDEQFAAAASTFGQLSRQATEPLERYMLAIIAGRAAEQAGDDFHSPPSFYRRAAEIMPAEGEAWERLVGWLASHEQGTAVAELCRSNPAQIAAAAPREDLLRAARSLDGHDAGSAFDIYGLLISSMPLTLTAEAEQQLLSDAVVAAESANRLPELLEMLERLDASLVDTRLASAIEERISSVRDRLGLDIDIDQVTEALRAGDVSDPHLDALENHAREHGSLAECADVFAEIAADTDDDTKAAQLLWRASRIHDALGAERTAIEAAERALLRLPRHAEAHLRLADHHQRRGNWDTVVNHLESAARQIHDQDRRGALYQRLGRIYEDELNRRSLALESYLVSFICRSDDITTLRRLEALYEAMGRWRDLVGSYEIAIQHARQSDEPTELDLEEIFVEKSRIEYQHLNDPKKSFESVLEAIRINPAERQYVDLVLRVLADHVTKDQVREAIETHVASLGSDEAAAAKARPDWAPYLAT